ncbi:MAG TPA: hypothetical protein VJM31_08175 [Vicinamibacterales bacterium]|nr:hypothetical protein [Vicinamibacterales bacterium]
MHRLARIPWPALALCFLTLGVQTAAAQTGTFLTGAGFVEIKQFESVGYDPQQLALGLDVDVASGNATGAGAGIRIGTFLDPRWSLELAVDAGSTTKKVFPHPFGFSPRFALRVPDVSASTRFLSISTVVGFHPQKVGRLRLGYLGGFSLIRGTHESELPDFSILSGFTFTSITDQFVEIFPRLPTTTTTIRRIDNSPGALLGLEAAIDVTNKLAAVPEIRVLAFSSGGRSLFLIRPGVGVRWSF